MACLQLQNRVFNFCFCKKLAINLGSLVRKPDRLPESALDRRIKKFASYEKIYFSYCQTLVHIANIKWQDRQCDDSCFLDLVKYKSLFTMVKFRKQSLKIIF